MLRAARTVLRNSGRAAEDSDEGRPGAKQTRLRPAAPPPRSANFFPRVAPPDTIRQARSGRNSVVEWQLPKLQVEGSNPFARSNGTCLAATTCAQRQKQPGRPPPATGNHGGNLAATSMSRLGVVVALFGGRRRRRNSCLVGAIGRDGAASAMRLFPSTTIEYRNYPSPCLHGLRTPAPRVDGCSRTSRSTCSAPPPPTCPCSACNPLPGQGRRRSSSR
jgi:hypothetical protein